MRVEEETRALERAQEELRVARENLLAERKLLDATMACLPGFFFMVDEEGRYQRWNKNVENTLGYSPEELQGRDARDLVPSEDREKIRKATERGFRTGSFEVEYRNMRKDGAKIPYYAQGIATEINGQRYLIGIELDLTKLKDTERALRESEDHLRSLMETATNFAVYRIAFENGDPEKASVVFVSPSIEEILGVTEPKNLNNWFENIHPEDRRRIIKAHFSLPRKTRADEAMRVFDSNSSTWRWVQFLSTSVMDENGLLKYSNGIIFDINIRMELTEKLKRKEAELQKKTNKLAQMNTALQVLVEHREQEINDIEIGILNTLHHLIKPYINDLAGTRLTDKQMTCLEIIQSNLEKIVSPLSKKLSTWQHRLTPTEIKVADMIRNGKTTKEIAEFLHISDNAVSFHRKHLRKKFGLVREKTNLSVYLRSLDHD